VIFDGDQRALAQAELFERWVASGADATPPAAIEVARALNAHDLGRLQAALPADFLVDDHRRPGIGHVAGADAWLASVAALYELRADFRMDDLYQAAVAPHGRVAVGRSSASSPARRHRSGARSRASLSVGHCDGRTGRRSARRWRPPRRSMIAAASACSARCRATAGSSRCRRWSSWRRTRDRSRCGRSPGTVTAT